MSKNKTQIAVDRVRRQAVHWTPEYRAELLKLGRKLIKDRQPPKRAPQTLTSKAHVDLTCLLRSLGLSVAPSKFEKSVACAFQYISVLKHIALEFAAYGDCTCVKTENPDECDYCLACKLYAMKAVRVQPADETRLAEFRKLKQYATFCRSIR